MQSIRSLLREHTSSLHAELDSISGETDTFGSLVGYGSYLQAMLALTRATQEDADWAAAQAQLEPTAGKNAARLSRDLLTLTERGFTPLDCFAESEASVGLSLTVGERWGSAYVMEGSAMGVSYMIKTARQQLPGEIGLSYMDGLASDAGQRWPKFTAALESVDCDPQKAIDGASTVFQLALQVFRLRCNTLSSET